MSVDIPVPPTFSLQVRAEVSILQSLRHPHIIEFIGVLLSPLCFILEWAPGGSLSSVFHKYRKMDARIGPLTLQHTAYQVCGCVWGGVHVWVGECGCVLVVHK